jgi:ubiquitin-protein ligase
MTRRSNGILIISFIVWMIANADVNRVCAVSSLPKDRGATIRSSSVPSSKLSSNHSKEIVYAAVNRSNRTHHKKRSSTMLRIQREWKDMIQAGIAFDWSRGEPIRNRSNQTSVASHIWIGPLSKYQWFVWHFSFTGDVSTTTENPYQQGIYHGRLLLPKTYPMDPPQLQMWTPNGRYRTFQNICLQSVTQYHPESWSYSMWNIHSIIASLRYHMIASTSANEIGSIQTSDQVKRDWALQSRSFRVAIPPHAAVDHGRFIQMGWIATRNSTAEPPLVKSAVTLEVPMIVKQRRKRSKSATTPNRNRSMIRLIRMLGSFLMSHSFTVLLGMLCLLSNL